MNGDSPVVRRAKASDAAAIAALQVRSWKAAYLGIVPDAFLDDLTEDAWLERWTDQLTAAGGEGVHQLVSTDARDGPPRAVAACGPAMEPTAELTGQLCVLYADPPSWGRGHGGALLRRVHELLARPTVPNADPGDGVIDSLDEARGLLRGVGEDFWAGQFESRRPHRGRGRSGLRAIAGLSEGVGSLNN